MGNQHSKMMPKPQKILFFSQIQDMCRYRILHETCIDTLMMLSNKFHARTPCGSIWRFIDITQKDYGPLICARQTVNVFYAFLVDYHPALRIKTTSPNVAQVSFTPSWEEQSAISSHGFNDQFVVSYDVRRQLDAGEVQVGIRFLLFDFDIIWLKVENQQDSFDPL